MFKSEFPISAIPVIVTLFGNMVFEDMIKLINVALNPITSVLIRTDTETHRLIENMTM
jgi:hypothetical protein